MIKQLLPVSPDFANRQPKSATTSIQRCKSMLLCCRKPAPFLQDHADSKKHVSPSSLHSRRALRSPAVPTPIRAPSVAVDDMDCIPDTPDDGSASKAVYAAAFSTAPGSRAGKKPSAPNGAATHTAAAAPIAAVAVAVANGSAARQMVPESPDEAPAGGMSSPQAVTQAHFSSTPAVLQEPPKSADHKSRLSRHPQISRVGGSIAPASSPVASAPADGATAAAAAAATAAAMPIGPHSLAAGSAVLFRQPVASTWMGQPALSAAAAGHQVPTAARSHAQAVVSAPLLENALHGSTRCDQPACPIQLTASLHVSPGAQAQPQPTLLTNQPANDPQSLQPSLPPLSDSADEGDAVQPSQQPRHTGSVKLPQGHHATLPGSGPLQQPACVHAQPLAQPLHSTVSAADSAGVVPLLGGAAATMPSINMAAHAIVHGPVEAASNGAANYQQGAVPLITPPCNKAASTKGAADQQQSEGRARNGFSPIDDMAMMAAWDSIERKRDVVGRPFW